MKRVMFYVYVFGYFFTGESRSGKYFTFAGQTSESQGIATQILRDAFANISEGKHVSEFLKSMYIQVKN